MGGGVGGVGGGGGGGGAGEASASALAVPRDGDLPRIPLPAGGAHVRRHLPADTQRRVLMLLDDVLRRRGVVSRGALAGLLAAASESAHVGALLRGVSAASPPGPAAPPAALCAEAAAGRPSPLLCETIDAFLYDSAARV